MAKDKKNKMQFLKNVCIKNKKASFEYEFINTYIAGIILTGTEIKSIRLGKASLVDSYCYFNNNELWMKQSYIAKFVINTYSMHDEYRERKLLLNRDELKKIQKAVEVQGITVIPVKMFINDKGLCKVEIAVAKGRKQYDKREHLKEQDSKKEMDKAIKNAIMKG